MLALIYGESGVGKTYSTLLTTSRLPEILKTSGKNVYFQIEPRDVKIQGLNLDNFTIVESSNEGSIYETAFKQLEAGLSEGKFDDPSTRPASIFIDSMSYLMNIALQNQIEDETFEAGTFNSKRKFVNRVKVDLGGYGAISTYMNRFCNLLAKISRKGVIVICSALTKLEEKRTNKIYPNFSGQKFSGDFPGWFDLIGYVYRQKKQVVVSFEPDEDDAINEMKQPFIAKNVGNLVKENPIVLDWIKILSLENHEKKTEEREVENVEKKQKR